MKKSIGILLFYLVSRCCHAQVSIAPTGLLLDGRGQGVMYIGNTGSQPQEVRIHFQFGYPGQDSMGALEMIYGDTIREKSHGLGPSIKAYPSAFTLQPPIPTNGKTTPQRTPIPSRWALFLEDKN